MEQINILTDIIEKYSQKFDVENLQKNLANLKQSVGPEPSNIIYLPVDKTKVRETLEMYNPEIVALRTDFCETKFSTQLIKVPAFSLEYKYEYYIHLCKTYEKEVKSLDTTSLCCEKNSLNRYRNKLFMCLKDVIKHNDFEYNYVVFVLNNLPLTEHMKQKCKRYINEYDALILQANKKYQVIENRLDEYLKNINC